MLPVGDCSGAEHDRRVIHRIGIKTVLDIIKVPDRPRGCHRVADTESGQTSRFGESLSDNHVVILMNKRQSALRAEIDICLIDDDNRIGIGLNDFFNRGDRNGYAGRSIRIGASPKAFDCFSATPS